jgi:hypothetical protein
VKSARVDKLMDYVYESLKKKYRREPTAEEYIGAQGLEPEDFEAERIAMAPRRLRSAISKLAEKARRDRDVDAGR